MSKYEYIILDIETSYGDRNQPWVEGSYLSSVGIRTSTGDEYLYFFNPLIGDYDKHIEQINWFIKNSKVVVGHNFLFDLVWLYSCGICNPDAIYCTMVNEYILRGQVFKQDKGVLSLNACAKHYGIPTKLDVMKQYWDNEVETCDIPVHIHKEYLSQDLKTTEGVYLKQRELIKQGDFEKISYLTHQMTRMLVKAKAYGAPFNIEIAKNIVEEAQEKINEYQEDIKKELALPFDINLGSSRQLCAALYGGIIKTDGRETYTVTLKSGEVKEKSRKCKIENVLPGVGWTTPFTTKKDQDTTSKDALHMLKATTPLQKKILPLLLSRAELTARIGTITGSKGDKGWLSTLGTDNRIHGGFSQTFTHTGRLNCTKPNLLNIPRDKTSPLKQIFNPGPGKVIINADLAQIEWRIAAQLCKDEEMCNELINGTDIHNSNAINILEAKEDPTSDEFKKGPRQTAKTVSFRLLYGGSAHGFYMDPKMPAYSKTKWERIVKGFMDKYPGLQRWWGEVAQTVEETGFYRLPSGRVIPSPKIDYDDESSKASWFRSLKNYPVQSFSGDIMLVVLNEFIKRVPDYFTDNDILLLFTVYDSFVFECTYEKASKVISIFLDIFENLTTIVQDFFNTEMLVPLDGDVEVGHDYGSLTKVNKKNYKETLYQLQQEEREEQNNVD